LTAGDYGKDLYIEPTIVTDVSDDMVISREEIFGPVLPVYRFEAEQEVIARANDAEYGLAAGVWTSNLAWSHRLAAGIEAGTIWVNPLRSVRSLRSIRWPQRQRPGSAGSLHRGQIDMDCDLCTLTVDY
jgi:acyl-CoA reductase-like NAD-dependent aldehyde dehydrogenase